MGPLDDLAAARLWAANEWPYLSTALFALSPVVVDGLGTFGVDRGWRLYLDPACFERWTIEQAGAVLVHEVNHLLRDHAGRAAVLGVGEGERLRFNIAGDLEINDDLRDLPLPPDGVLPERFGLQPGELAEAYYTWIGPHVNEGPDCGSGADGARRPWELPSDAGPHVGPAEADLIRQDVATKVRALGDALGSSGLARWAEAFLQPKVDWRRVMAAAVRGGLQHTAGAVDFTYRRPSRRQATATVPRIVQPALRQSVPTVAIVIDTSASMSAALLERAVAEIRGLLRLVGVAGDQLTVLSCDSAVHTVERVFSVEQVHPTGGGGTDMGAGIEAAVRLRPQPSVVVVLTDGLTPWPEVAPPGCRVVVGLLGEGAGNGPPWAQVIEVPAD